MRLPGWRFWLAIFVVSVVLGMGLYQALPPVHRLSPAPSPNQAGSVTPSVSSAEIGPNTLIVWRTYYTQSDDTHEDSAVAPPETWGHRPDREAAKLFPGWEVLSFTSDRLVLFRKMDSLCPIMATYRTLAAEGGYVALFYGEPGHMRLERVTNIPVASLDTNEQERVLGGIVFMSEEEALRYLEGLTE